MSAGVVLVDGVGREVLRRVKDSSRLRLHGGVVYAGDRVVAEGVEQGVAQVATQLVEAKAGMAAQLEAFSSNTIAFLRRERALLLDGQGAPRVGPDLRGKHVLVVAAGHAHGDDLRKLRGYIADHRPVFVGVGSGADALRDAGRTPDVIVADPTALSAETLGCGADVVVPAHPDGQAPGRELLADLGVGHTTFVASGNPEDLALLLADANGAELIVTVGFQATLGEFLDRERSGSNPSTFLTRLRLGSKVVDGASLIALQRKRSPTGVVPLLSVVVLIGLLIGFLVPGPGAALLEALTGSRAVLGEFFGGLLR